MVRVIRRGGRAARARAWGRARRGRRRTAGKGKEPRDNEAKGRTKEGGTHVEVEDLVVQGEVLDSGGHVLARLGLQPHHLLGGQQAGRQAGRGVGRVGVWVGWVGGGE